MSSRKQLRVVIPPEQAEQFIRHKRRTEAAMAVSLTDSQYARMLVTQALKTLEKTR